MICPLKKKKEKLPICPVLIKFRGFFIDSEKIHAGRSLERPFVPTFAETKVSAKVGTNIYNFSCHVEM